MSKKSKQYSIFDSDGNPDEERLESLVNAAELIQQERENNNTDTNTKTDKKPESTNIFKTFLKDTGREIPQYKKYDSQGKIVDIEFNYLFEQKLKKSSLKELKQNNTYPSRIKFLISDGSGDTWTESFKYETEKDKIQRILSTYGDGRFDNIINNKSTNKFDFLDEAKRIAINAVKSAGEPLREIHKNVEDIRYKTDKSDIVTEADYRSEKIITQTIRNEFPNHSIISEEEFTYKTDKSDYTWILDPLDGTGNFVHGNPNYSISLALVKNNDILVGVVYAPETQDCYSAIKNRGAWLDEKEIKVTNRDKLAECMLLSGYDPDGEFITKFYRETQGVRAIGSTSLNLCYVASGSADGGWEFDTYPWDIAAGILIVREYGGSVLTDMGDEFRLNITNRDKLKPLLSTNGNIQDNILNKL